MGIPLSLWCMASVTPDLRLPSQSQSITALWPVLNYTAWHSLREYRTVRSRTHDLLIASPCNALTMPRQCTPYVHQTWLYFDLPFISSCSDSNMMTMMTMIMMIMIFLFSTMQLLRVQTDRRTDIQTRVYSKTWLSATCSASSELVSVSTVLSCWVCNFRACRLSKQTSAITLTFICHHTHTCK